MGITFTSDWEVRSIGSLTDVFAGGTPSTQVDSYWGGDIRWMNSGELNLRKVFEVENRITEEGLKNSSARLIPKNCVLIGLAGQGKTRGTVAINKVELTTNQSVAAIYPSKEFVPEYLYYNLDLRYNELRDLSDGGGGRGGLNLKLIKGIDIPLPSMEEQKAIADALSDIDELMSELVLEIKKLEDFKLSQIYLFLNPDSLFKNGIVTQSYLLSNIANFSKGRGQNKGNLIESGDFPCILYGELFTTYGEIIDTVVSKSSTNEGLSSVSGDVLIPGSTTTVGRDLATASVIKQNGVLLGGDINIIRFNDLKTILPDYFAYLFKFILVDQVEQMAQGTTIKHLYGKDIIKLSIDLPPIDYQAQAIRYLSITEKRITSAKSEMKKYECIKQGMAHDLLTGKVRLV